jgi:glucuronoarabinoxylan endo-1,4-beta-xylanase
VASEEHQSIRGFGASSAWTATNLTEAEADQFFSEETGIGLSLIRLRIAPDGSTWERATARQAQERGARVWAAPWSPPGEWKTSGTDANGGSLLPQYYDAWADRLAGFIEAREREGIRMFALSLQNEPNWVAEWETCEWTPRQLVTFLRDHLAPMLQARRLETKLVAPETANWTSLAEYSDPIFDDDLARGAVDVIGVHSYGGTAFAYAKPASFGKEFWQSEIHDAGPRDDGIESALRVARMVHDHLTIAGVNAWHYWWMMTGSTTTTNSSLMNGSIMTQRGYALGNFSKFVRPGFVRVSALPSNPRAGVHVTAFKNTALGRIVVVAINENETVVTQRFWLEGANITSITPFITSETSSLAEQAVRSVGDSFDYALPPKSITSFVGVDDGAGGAGAGGAAGQAGTDSGGSTNGGATGGSGATSSFGGVPSAGTAGSGASVIAGADDEVITPDVRCWCRVSSAPEKAPTGSVIIAISAYGAWLARRREKQTLTAADRRRSVQRTV